MTCPVWGGGGTPASPMVVSPSHTSLGAAMRMAWLSHGGWLKLRTHGELDPLWFSTKGRTGQVGGPAV